MIAASLSFPRNGHLNLLLQNRLKLPNKTYMSKTLLHHNSHSLRPPFPAVINRIFKHLNGDTIPSHPLAVRAYFLFKREVAIQLQIQRMVLANLGVLRFVHNLATHMQLGKLRVEI